MADLTPSQCFTRNILPRWQSYIQSQDTLWKAMDLASALYAHIEWIYSFYSNNDNSRLLGATRLSEFRDKIFNQCPALEIMHDLADASKHRHLTIQPENRTFTSSTGSMHDDRSKLYVTNTGVSFHDYAFSAFSYWKAWPD